MAGDPRYRELPRRARTIADVIDLGHILHDCRIDVEGMTPERPEPKRRIVSFRLPLYLDDGTRPRRPDPSPWELVIRSPRSIAIEDEALIAVYTIIEFDCSEHEFVIRAAEDLTIRVGVHELDVAVEARRTD